MPRVPPTNGVSSVLLPILLVARLALFVVGFFFVRIFRRLRLLTFIEFFENRYGTTAATVAAVATIASNIGWTGALLVAFGFVFESLTGVPLEYGIMGGAIVVFVYTVAGGMWAVAITDFVQMVVIAFGLVMLLIVVLIDVGGWGNIGPTLTGRYFSDDPRRAYSLYLAQLPSRLAHIRPG